MTDELGVGLVGVSADRGWAREGHVPAIAHVAGLRLAAVATRDQGRAEAAARAFGATRAYDDVEALAADPDVAIVAVASPVPSHRATVLAALAAGKHVLSEWPLGVDRAETESLAAAAAETSLHTAIGLQGRMNPAARRALELVAQGRIGRVLSVDVLSTTAAFGPTIPPEAEYLEDPAAGMNLATIQTAHTLDLAVLFTGRPDAIATTRRIQYPDVRVGGREEVLRRRLADEVRFSGTAESGSTLDVHVVGGRTQTSPFRLEVLGTEGAVTLTGGGPRGFQADVLRLAVDGVPEDVVDAELAGLPDPVVNVAANYRALRDDIAHGGTSAPSFTDAARLAALLDALLAAPGPPPLPR